MSAPTHQFNANNDPTLSNTAATAGVSSSFRNPILSASSENQSTSPPLLPPRPNMGIQSNYAMSPYSYGGMGSYGMNSYGGYGAGGYGGFGGGYGMTGMGMSPYSGFNRYGGMGPMYGDIENRFIQMAEENSRPAFDSIQSVVNAVGSVAMMLENTFFALTSSFRAILGVAENFGRLRSLFAQFWSTFAVIRSLNWLIRKLLVLLGIRTEAEFKAWTEAVAATQGIDNPEQPRGSSWPILLFFGVITAAPYIVLRMLSSLNNNIREKLNDPTTWQDPLRAVAQHEFQATSPQELSFNIGQVLTIAPQHLQTNLWQSGWLMASTDGQHAGLVPVTYLKVFKVTHQGGPNTNNDQSVNPSNPNHSVPEKPVEPNVADLDKFYGQEL